MDAIGRSLPHHPIHVKHQMRSIALTIENLQLPGINTSNVCQPYRQLQKASNP